MSRLPDPTPASRPTVQNMSKEGPPGPPESRTLTFKFGEEAREVKRHKKVYVCDAPGCNKSFHRKDYLFRHAANHKEVKPYMCAQCQVGFARMDILEKHYKSKTHQKRRDELMSQARVLVVENITPPAATTTATGSRSAHRQVSASMAPDQQTPTMPTQSIESLPPADMTTLTAVNPMYNVVNTEISQLYQYRAQMYPENTATASGSYEQDAFARMSPPLGYEPFGGPSSSFHDSSVSYPDPHNFNLTSNNDKFNWLFGTLSDPTITIKTDASLSDAVVGSSPAAINSDTSQFPQISIAPMNLGNLSEILTGTDFSAFTGEEVDDFMNLYWTNFNPMYPIVHRSTFDPNQVDIYLLIAVLSIGMVYSGPKAYECSIKIHNVFRNLLFHEIGDSPNIRLSLLQAILLDNYYCKMLGTTTQFKMSQLYHGTAINLLRFSGYLSNLSEPTLTDPSKLTYIEQSRKWKEWIKYETSKRTAFFGFILDSQHAALYRHTQLLSAFEIQLELPFSDATWNATSYISLYREYKKQPKDLLSRPKPNWKVDLTKLANTAGDSQDTETLRKKLYSRPPMLNVGSEGSWPAFLWSMRRLMSPYKEHQKEYPMTCFSQFGRLILLHGVLSISWDLKWRSLLDLGFVSKRGLVDLSNRLMIALLNWRGYFDKQIGMTNKIRLGVQQPTENLLLLNDYGVSNIFWTNITLFQLAQIVLHVDTLAIIKLANDFVTTGPTSYAQGSKKDTDARNREKIQAWTRAPEGKILVAESCRLLRTVLNKPELVQTIPHIPWSIYISALCIWALETFAELKIVSTSKEPAPHISSYKYFKDDEVSIENCEADALAYISAKLEEDSNNPNDKSNEKIVKVYWQVQQQVIAILALTNCLLKSNHWENTRELRHQLEKLIDAYKY